jgi:hypothetical protein
VVQARGKDGAAIPQFPLRHISAWALIHSVSAAIVSIPYRTRTPPRHVGLQTIWIRASRKMASKDVGMEQAGAGGSDPQGLGWTDMPERPLIQSQLQLPFPLIIGLVKLPGHN